MTDDLMGAVIPELGEQQMHEVGNILSQWQRDDVETSEVFMLVARMLADATERGKAEAFEHRHAMNVNGECFDCERLAGEGGTAVYEQGKAEGREEAARAVLREGRRRANAGEPRMGVVDAARAARGGDR